MGKSNSKSSQPIIFQKIKEMNIDSSFKEILTNDIDLDERNNKGQTPLIYAAQIGNLQAVKMLIDSGKVDIDARDNEGNNALMAASENGHVEIVKMLINRDIEIDARNSNNETVKRLTESFENQRKDDPKLDADIKDLIENIKDHR